MSGFRFMRMVVFFDLPVLTVEDRRVYSRFRKALIQNGFIMMQESVYCKLMTSPTMEGSVRNMLDRNRPDKGLVQTLLITEKQFVKMDFLVGEKRSEYVDTEDRVVVL